MVSCGGDARGILSHSDELKLVFQHLDKILRKPCTFGTLSQVLEEISDRVYRAGQGRDLGLFTFAFAGFCLSVIASSEGFRLDEIAEVSVGDGSGNASAVERRKRLVISAHFLVRSRDRQVDSRYPEHIAWIAG